MRILHHLVLCRVNNCINKWDIRLSIRHLQDCKRIIFRLPDPKDHSTQRLMSTLSSTVYLRHLLVLKSYNLRTRRTSLLILLTLNMACLRLHRVLSSHLNRTVKQVLHSTRCQICIMVCLHLLRERWLYLLTPIRLSRHSSQRRIRSKD